MIYDRLCLKSECGYSETDCYEHYSHPSVIECPKCGASTFSRVLSAPARIDFKGSGQFNSWLDKQRAICSNPSTGFCNHSVDNH